MDRNDRNQKDKTEINEYRNILKTNYTGQTNDLVGDSRDSEIAIVV